MADYKIVIQPERFTMVNKKDKEAELAKLENILDNLTITEIEVRTWKEEELERRQARYLKRIQETKDILDIING